ncbi:hypothetical protein F3Y22_tig00116970pilonHSYRG00312 [Hibiscus syriacus]|uniref:Pectinesterase catalytic domain-containing protein n=1 Tax=Hibiscus syriacus TaxID=106335 RepID=A0A6A2X9I7_HIBSY|nr:hypothetical protein F3Y22_tig00116970pilonHSYRG00312 [Hibiscus syriacus]
MEIKKVLVISKTLQDLEKDKGTKDALSVCKEVLDYAIDDLEASFNKLAERSGKYNNIVKALAEVPKKNAERFVIYIKAGLYNEKVDIPKGANNVLFIGDGWTKTIITNNISVVRNKITTFHTETVAVNAMNIIAQDIGIENAAGYEGEQVVALRAYDDLGVFYNYHFNGYQDTLYPQKEMQFRDCVITVTIDFIFGDSRVGKQFDKSRGGFVLHNCTISGDKDYISVKNVNKAVATVFRLDSGIRLRLRKMWIGVTTDHLFKNKWVDRIPYFLPDLRLTRNMSGSGVGYGQGRISTLEPPFRSGPFVVELNLRCLESNILHCEVEIGSEIGKLLLTSSGPFVMKLNLRCLESNILRCEVEIGSEIGKLLLTSSSPFVVKLNLRCLKSNILCCEVEIGSEIEKLLTSSGPFVVKLNLRCLKSNILRCEVEIGSEIEKLFVDNQSSLRCEVELVLSRVSQYPPLWS